jgi:hypothetical protein
MDGANRLRIASEFDLAVPFEIHRGLSGEEKEQLALDLNVDRRHISPEERTKARAERMKRVHDKVEAGQSRREVAKEEGISESQVRLDLDDYEDSSAHPPCAAQQEQAAPSDLGLAPDSATPLAEGSTSEPSPPKKAKKPRKPRKKHTPLVQGQRAWIKMSDDERKQFLAWLSTPEANPSEADT